jgi:hypothetical protein
MLSTPSTHDQHRHSARRLWWYVALTRAALAFAVGAVIALLLGILCVPNGFVNIKVVTSLFAGLQANGAFISWPRPLFEIAGLLAVLSVGTRFLIRVAYRVRHE